MLCGPLGPGTDPSNPAPQAERRFTLQVRCTIMALRYRVLSVAVCLLTVACLETTGPDSTDEPNTTTPTETGFSSSTVKGTYDLVRVNNQALPYVSGGRNSLGTYDTTRVSGGTLTLNSSGSYSLSVDWQFCTTSPPGGCQNGPLTSTGTFTTSGSSRITLTENSTKASRTATWGDMSDTVDATASVNVTYASGQISLGLRFEKD